MRLAIALLTILLSLVSPPVLAQTISGVVVINGRAIPLPPGEWQMLGRGANESMPRFAGAITTLGSNSALLAQEQAGRLSALISIVAGDRGESVVYRNWEVMACARTQWSLNSLVREGTDRYQNCADIRTWTGTTQRPANPNARWVQYFDTAKARPGWAPAIFHTAWSRVAERTGSLDVIYHFSPETRGFARDERPWAQNSWNPANQTDAQKAYIARMSEWLREAHARVRRGYQMGSADPLPPF